LTEPDCRYCGDTIPEESGPVAVELTEGAWFRWDQGSIDLDSYGQEEINFYHRNCWKQIAGKIEELPYGDSE